MRIGDTLPPKQPVATAASLQIIIPADRGDLNGERTSMAAAVK